MSNYYIHPKKNTENKIEWEGYQLKI